MGGQQPGPPAGTSSLDVGEALASGAPQHASGVKAGLRRSEAPAAPAHPLPPPEAPRSQPRGVCHQQGRSGQAGLSKQRPGIPPSLARVYILSGIQL